jgi:hypothetical protein
MAYSSQYPPAYNDTYVKATTTYASTRYYPYFATDPSTPLTGVWEDASWISLYAVTTNQRFHIDLGSAKTIKRIYYENIHYQGGYGYENLGVKTFTFWGSNDASAFAELTYGTDTNWTQLTTATNTFDAHVAADQADPKYILVTNSTAYRYYAFKFADNQGGTLFMAVRRIELQKLDSTDYTQSCSDTFTSSESFSRVSEFMRTLTDTFTISESISRGIGKRISDIFTFSEAMARHINLKELIDLVSTAKESLFGISKADKTKGMTDTGKTGYSKSEKPTGTTKHTDTGNIV